MIDGSGSAADLVRLEALNMSYREGSRTRLILTGLNAGFGQGRFSVLLGQSGSGKSTLLNLIAGLDQPSSGRIWIGDTELTALSERQRTLFRRRHIGIVFQFFNLLPGLSVIENVLLPLQLNGRQAKSERQAAVSWLSRVGLGDRLDTHPDRLSGGEMQRVAIVRAMLHDPVLILADEPTGNLDEATAAEITELLLGLVREQNLTLIMVTHNPELAARADAVYEMHEGKLSLTRS
ncbi:MAG: ABC transporter ATP-binding protein [Candidatus Melainabacteria bacterium HGW-Melainabacteria-1]|nr:MAG: ABC transporter ATP-binding protein [Candidatus Melainabacteria bacterium HGW-Melainabacteria-1]